MQRLQTRAARKPLRFAIKPVGNFFTSRPIAWSAYQSQRPQNTAKYLLRSLSMPNVAAVWLKFLFDTPLLETLMRRRPRLLFKIHRANLKTAYQPLDRLAALRAHYDFLETANRLLLQEIINSPSNNITLFPLPSRVFFETESYLLTLAISALGYQEKSVGLEKFEVRSNGPV